MPQIIPAVLGTVATSAVGSLFNRRGNEAVQGRLGASDEQLRGTRMNDINATGFSSRVGQNAAGIRTINFSRSAGVNSALLGIQNRSRQAAGQFAELRGRVAPGMSDLRNAALSQISETQRRSIGGLRETLRQRRLGGSSFEAQAVGDETERFERLRQEILGGIGIQEIQMTAELIGQEFEAAMTGIGATLEQFNFESELAAGIQNASTALQQSIVAARAGIGTAAAQAESAFRQGEGSIWQPVIDGLGGIVQEGVGRIMGGNQSTVTTTGATE